MGKHSLESQKIAESASSIPRPPKPWRKCDTATRWKYRYARVIYRRIHEKGRCQRLAARIRKLRKFMHADKALFAKLMGVSEISIRRWEGALGHMPLREHMKRIAELEQSMRELKKQGVEIDPAQFRRK